MYVAKLADDGDLQLYADRGVPLISAKTADPYWDTVPWKEAAKYPADGILYDMRQTVFPLSVAKKIQQFAELPAVQANQIASWRADPPPSYQAYTSRMDELAKTIADWRKVT